MYVTEDEAFELLAKAVVVQTAEDYGNALLGNFKCSNARTTAAKNAMMLHECKQFFLSDALRKYTNIEGKVIMEEIEKQIKFWPRNQRFVLDNIIKEELSSVQYNC